LSSQCYIVRSDCMVYQLVCYWHCNVAIVTGRLLSQEYTSYTGTIPISFRSCSNTKKVTIVWGPILIQFGINPLYSPSGPSARIVLLKQSKADLYGFVIWPEIKRKKKQDCIWEKCYATALNNFEDCHNA
jgi:hypothetical protein